MQNILLKNINIDDWEYKLNEFVSLRKIDDRTFLSIGTGDKWKTNLPLWIRSLQLAFPEINLRMESEEAVNQSVIDAFTGLIINYYAKTEYNFNIDTVEIDINQDDVNHLISVNSLIIDFNKKSKYMTESGNWEPNRWIYAYNQYLDACKSPSIETSILNLVTALESLLVRGSGEISYRVSLFSSLVFSDIYEDRKETFDLVRKMYNIRSKVVHGEINEVIKMLSSDDIYDKYFRLKETCADILIKLYNIDETVIFEKIYDALISCPEFSIE